MVQRRFVLVLILLSVLTLIGCGGSSDSSTSAPTVSVIKTNATFDLTDVAVSPSGTIYAATYLPSFGGPSVLRSVDQGQTWQELTTGLKPPFHRILAIDDNSTGFIFTFNREMFKTTDGGTTWTLVSSNVPEPYERPFFVDEHLGVVVSGGGNGTIYQTNDGGRTWRKIFDTPSGISSLRKVNRTTALFVGKGGLLGRITLNS